MKKPIENPEARQLLFLRTDRNPDLVKMIGAWEHEPWDVNAVHAYLHQASKVIVDTESGRLFVAVKENSKQARSLSKDYRYAQVEGVQGKNYDSLEHYLKVLKA